MIKAEKLNSEFEQCPVSCVPSSYAIVSNYFTGAKIKNIFEDYCKHFDLSFSNALEAERLAGNHLNVYSTSKGCKGYEIMTLLHERSQQNVFERGRQLFRPIFFLEAIPHLDEIENILKDKEALLNITYEVGTVMNQSYYHSVTAGWTQANSLIVVDTQNPGLKKINRLRDLGALKDAVLYIER